MIWKEKATLILADLHLGKITHFRKAGIGIPKEAALENLERLSNIILNNDIERVLILGDLFHSDYNAEWAEFKDFCQKFSDIPFVLVKGNHDILASDDYIINNLEVYPEKLYEGPFCFTHIPYKGLKEYNICGHIHPAIKLRGVGLQSLRLPCYYFSKESLVLPAFGTFTGMAAIKPQRSDTIYAISDDSVINVL